MNDTTIIILSLSTIAAWLTHIFFCFSNAAWGFLIAGAILPPIGVIHGFYLWFQ